MRAAGVVLAGGRSLRMGRSKAWLEWHGATLLERVVAVVGRAVDGGPIVVVAADGQALPPLPEHVVVVTDARPGLGPLQGIGTGLAALTGLADAAFVSSTDAPLLHPVFVRRVLAGLTPDDDAVVPLARGHRQPLAAAYRVSLAPLIDSLLEQRLAKPGYLYERTRTRFVNETWLLDDPGLARVDPSLDSLENLNEPTEYDAARARALPSVTVELSGSGRLRHVSAISVADAARALGLPAGPFAALPLAAGDSLRAGPSGLRLRD